LQWIPPTIDHLNIKARVRGTKARLFPGLDRYIFFGGTMVGILGQAFPIPAYVSAVQMKYVDAKTLDTSYLSFDIGNGRHSYCGAFNASLMKSSTSFRYRSPTEPKTLCPAPGKVSNFFG